MLYPTMLVYREGTFYFTPEIVASLAKARPVFLKNPSMPLMYYSKALLVPLSHIPFCLLLPFTDHLGPLLNTWPFPFIVQSQ